VTNSRIALNALAVGLLPSAAALALTSRAAPLRTSTGLFFTLTIVPVVQMLAASFFGWRPALGVGAAAAALIVWLCLGAPPEVTQQDPRWVAALPPSDYAARSSLAPPSRPRAARVLTAGGSAVLFVCALGESPELEVRLAGHPLSPVDVPLPGPCWRPFAVPPELVRATNSTPLESFVAARSSPVEVVGGYTKPREHGGQSDGAALIAGQQVRLDDLSPSTPGAQTGRYWVELRIFDASGRLVEIWY
jgi:hypothetical protein